MTSPVGRGDERPLSVPTKLVLALGDLSGNAALSTLSLVYATYFLVEVVGLRPALAGIIPLVGRTVDAITDPAMGRISDHTRLRLGRRRPYLLAGAVPFGVAFALLWSQAPPAWSEEARCVFYAVTYVLLACAMTVLLVPYLALLPEMALGYDERTSVSAYRHVGSVIGIGLALGLRPTAAALGGGPRGFQSAGILYGVVLSLPWLVLFACTWERPDFRERPAAMPLMAGLRTLARHRAYLALTGLYLCGRIAMDLVGALLILYFTHYLGRSRDFEPAMLAFLAAVMLAAPLWLAVGRGWEKVTVFRAGALWWMSVQAVLALARPEWPRWAMFATAVVLGVGYAAVDFMPWAMIGDVVDEDDLATGERREGLYNGAFGFLRKLAGAAAVFLALAVLDVAGYRPGEPPSPGVLTTLRLLTGVGPIVLLALALACSTAYPLDRRRHAEILQALDARARRRR